MQKKREKGISASTLKMLAILGMTLDHIGVMFGDYLPLEVVCGLYAFGGMTFPIMAYFLGEGYIYTSNIKKYAMRLLAFAVISEIPFRLFLNHNSGNVLFTLFLGLAAIYLYEHMQQNVYWVVFIGLVIASSFFDWGVIGVPMVLLYYIRREKKDQVVLPYLLPVVTTLTSIMEQSYRTGSLGFFLPAVFYVAVGCTLTIPLLSMYNKTRGKMIKYFFYGYYPIHIVVLGIIKRIWFS